MLSAALSSGIGAVLVLAGVPKVGDRARMTRDYEALYRACMDAPDGRVLRTAS